jgi:PAS domain S-box-containing protein
MATLPTANSDLTEEEQPILSSRPQSSGPQLTVAPSLDSSVEAERLEAEQVHLLYARSAVVALSMLPVGAAFLVILLWPLVSHVRLVAWAGLMGTLALVRWMIVRHYQRKAHFPEEVRYWRTLLFISVTITGCGWGLAGLFLFPTGAFLHQTLLVTFLGGVLLISLANLVAIRSLFFAFLLSLLTPTVLRLFLSEESGTTTLGLFYLLFGACLVLIATYMHAAITESLRLRLVNLDLVNNLSAAKEHAEQVSRQLTASHAALSLSEERFRSLIEHASDVSMILNADSIIRYTSPSLQPVLGYVPETLVGQAFPTLLHPEDAEKISTLLSSLRQEPGGTRSFECRWRAHDGSWRIVESIAHNLLADTTVTGIILNSRDITDRKEIERLKDDLVSTVSHELRTPLASLRGFTELMLTREFSSSQRQQYLTIMQKETIRLSTLINDFLDLQRIESGRQTYHLESIDLVPLLNEALALFSSDNTQHTFYINAPCSPLSVRADADRIQQVLTNLLSNAVKFSPNGGTIRVEAQQQGEFIVVKISDEGIGIAAEMIPQLFRKFFRIDNAATRKIGGTGLGLALVKQIIEAHNGQVWVESKQGEGSSFAFSLPVVPS